jgi:UDP-N-acetylglucosamine 1-carboxyvinyltransferase
MDKLLIRGGRELNGTVHVSGAKNALLPAMAASLLTDQTLVLRNVSTVRDVRTMIRLLEMLGKTVEWIDGDSAISITNGGETGTGEVPYDLVKTMRASVLCLGPLLARRGSARVSLPGGCAIGARPVDLHLYGLGKMGARVAIDQGYIETSAPQLFGTEIFLDKPTVTGTENLLMAASLADGKSVIRNAAREPEISDLVRLLGAMGCNIEGEGTATLTVHGVQQLGGADHRVIPDRIEAATYVIAGAMAGGRVRVEGCGPELLPALLELLQNAGVPLETGEQAITVTGGSELIGRDMETSPFPGFPTDVQAQYMALMTQAKGASVITESVFENRFMHVAELRRLGASIRDSGRTAVVEGPTQLNGAQVMATDIRASASLVVAGLAASGETLIDRIYHLDRGYEKLEEKLGSLGADIERIT